MSNIGPLEFLSQSHSFANHSQPSFYAFPAIRRSYEHKFLGTGYTVRLTSVAQAVAHSAQPAVLRTRHITRSLAPFAYAPCVAAAHKDTSQLGEILPVCHVCTLEGLVATAGGGGLPAAEAAYVGACLVLALDHVHWSGVMYRSMSPRTVRRAAFWVDVCRAHCSALRCAVSGLVVAVHAAVRCAALGCMGWWLLRVLRCAVLCGALRCTHSSARRGACPHSRLPAACRCQPPTVN